MVRKAKTTSKKTADKAKPKTVVAEVEAPPSIAELLAVAKTIKGIKVDLKYEKQLEKIAENCTKLSTRIAKGLGSEAKKAEKEAKAKVKADAKTKREAARNEKKLAKIAKLREQLAALEAPAANAK